MGGDRSTKVIVGVAGTLGLGIVLGYALPWVTSSGDYGDSSSASLSDVGTVLNMVNRGWAYDLARLGVVAAIVAAVAFPRRLRSPQALVITLGSVLGLMLPIVLKTKAFGDGDAMGSGMIPFGLACVVAAIAPWVLMAGDGNAGLPNR